MQRSSPKHWATPFAQALLSSSHGREVQLKPSERLTARIAAGTTRVGIAFAGDGLDRTRTSSGDLERVIPFCLDADAVVTSRY